MTYGKEQRRKAVKQTLASWALEGFEPDEKYMALMERYINGELTMEQARAQTYAEFGVDRQVADLKTA